jgi:ATP-dependent helicase/nuclease subunit B
MTAKVATKVWRIPAGIGFANALATGLLERVKDNPLGLAEMQILLPTRRACRTLQQAFLRESEGKALLLPRLQPLGDLDADELLLSAGITIPPAVTARQRQLLLAQLISQHQHGLPAAQYLLLAKAFARLLDDAALEDVPLDNLTTLVTGELAGHWQTTLNFITPLRAHWQGELDRLQLCDIATRRNLLLKAQADAWRERPPVTPVILAGSTGALPAIVTVMQSILTLPAGEIVLPALPAASEVATWWDKVEDTHPLAELKNLLEKLGVAHADVGLWPAAPERENGLLHHALRPATTSDQWAKQPTLQTKTIARLDCVNEQEEASTIALIMREVLEQPERTALLITPDRNLGRRVASALQRWGLQVDDSAGTPLQKTESAVFLRLVLRYVLQPQDPVALLALLKHPMLTAGLPMGLARSHAQTIELEALRRRPPIRNLPSMAMLLPDLADWLSKISTALQPLAHGLAKASLTLPELLQALITSAEALAQTESKPGSERLWRGEAGRTLADWASELLEAKDIPISITPADAEDYLLALQADTVVRARYGEHPRLTILGPVEARLQQADCVILAGLNEGIWPAPPEPDPWLSRPMRAELGLKSPEARLGQEAHDFYSHAASSNVIITRAIRQEGTPTLPARWLRRLDIVLQGQYASLAADYLALARALDAADTVKPALPPAPTPPAAARPRKLSVTQLEKLLQDPYAIYAQKVLRLKKLDPLDIEPGAAERGNFYHEVLHKFVKAYPAALPANSRALLLELGDKLITEQGYAEHKKLWWPRFERMIDWFLAAEATRRTHANPLETEVEGALTLSNGFLVTAKADRIDRTHTGKLAVLDYKTGSLPTQKQQEAGFSLQLPLEGAMAQSGGFKRIPAAKVQELTFWQLTGGNPAGKILSFRPKSTPEQSIKDAVAQVEALTDIYARSDTPYYAEPDAAHPPRFSDTRHLARWKEWALLGDEEDEA